MHILDDLDHFAEASQDPAALSSVREARSGLDKLISKMDSLEAGFDRIAERSCEALRVHSCMWPTADTRVRTIPSTVSFAIVEPQAAL